VSTAANSSRDLDLWAYHKGVELGFSRPGKPTDNSYNPPSFPRVVKVHEPVRVQTFGIDLLSIDTTSIRHFSSNTSRSTAVWRVQSTVPLQIEKQRAR
jgi:hypothetical protein